MKIAQVVCAWPPYAGGISRSANQIERLLAASHEIKTFSPANLKPWLKYGHGAFLPQLLWKLRGYDYIYLHFPFFGAAEVVWLLKRLRPQTKLILHYHMDVKNRSLAAKILSLPSGLIRASLFKRAEIVVTASLDYVKNSRIKKIYDSWPEKFREITFGLDLNKFQPKLANWPTKNRAVAQAKEIINYINDRFIKRDCRQFIFVGGLDRAHYFKGVDLLLRALVLVNPRSWRLTIVGAGDLRSSYEALAAKLKINRQVEFKGKLNDAELIRVLQNSDLLILPSLNRNEAFGLVLVEALACGVPVVASNLPGVRTVFNDHEQGLLVTPGDEEDLKKKLEFILNNEGLRRVMALAARRLAEEKYDEKKMRARLEELFV